MSILSAYSAIMDSGIDAGADDVLFVFSTTKGNVELLDEENSFEKERVYLWRSAQIVAKFFGNDNEPVVVSNACISGCAAQIAAMNYLENHNYKYAVVIGAEVLSKFIVSGFQSFKALSPTLCKPFDKNRCGLNLGEAAATIVYAKEDDAVTVTENAVRLVGGAMHNDANHISAPSRTGEGLYRSLMQLCPHNIAFISAHGTATAYNDDMESVAINRAGLNRIPVTSLKGYFGHTLGAAGVVESIISCHALQNHIVLKTAGTEEVGTVNPINVCLANAEITELSFIKMMSGFGGSNAALLFTENKKID